MLRAGLAGREERCGKAVRTGPVHRSASLPEALPTGAGNGRRGGGVGKGMGYTASGDGQMCPSPDRSWLSLPRVTGIARAGRGNLPHRARERPIAIPRRLPR